MDSAAIKTYAKINLSLDVLGRRDDGYHEVRMIMHQIKLHDIVTVTVSENTLKNVEEELTEHLTSDSITSANEQPRDKTGSTQQRLADSENIRISLTCNKQSVPQDDSNIAVKAARDLSEMFEHKFRNKHIHINIEKNIPVAAGLAGGSSNAAGVIIALNSLMDLGMNLDDMMRIGLRSGADVPFCIMGQAAMNPEFKVKGGAVCALSEGIGEILTPLKGISAYVLLSKPPLMVSTAEVYKAFDEIDIVEHPDTFELVKAVEEGNIKKINEKMINVLEKITLTKYPYVRITYTIMRKWENATPRMSGSGPSIFALFESPDHGMGLYELMKERNEETFFTETCKYEAV